MQVAQEELTDEQVISLLLTNAARVKANADGSDERKAYSELWPFREEAILTYLYPTLHAYPSERYIRPALLSEFVRSAKLALADGGYGIYEENGREYYVQSNPCGLIRGV